MYQRLVATFCSTTRWEISFEYVTFTFDSYAAYFQAWAGYDLGLIEPPLVPVEADYDGLS